MKKWIAAILLTVTALAFSLYYCRTPEAVRIHIVAADDSAGAQAQKEQVRDAVSAYLGEGLRQCACKQEAEAYLQQESENVRKLAEQTAGQTVQVTLGEEDFPERRYGTAVYPAGRYTALRITLGEGKGHNWWCVAFPTLCYGGEKKPEYRSLVVTLLQKWGIL